MHGNEATTVLKRDMLGRVAYPREQREALLDEFERSGLKGRPFAQVAGIKYPTFANWVQQRRRARDGCAVAPGLPLPAGSDPPLARAVRLVEAVLQPTSGPAALAATDTSALEVLLPGGARLLMRDAGQAALAAQLIKSLAVASSPC